MKYIERLLRGAHVEWRPLGKVSEILRGKRLLKSQLDAQGKYPVYQNSMTPLGYYDVCNMPACSTYIISAGAAGSVGYSSEPFWAADDVYVLRPIHGLMSKYLYYCLLARHSLLDQYVRRASIPRLARVDLAKILIPIPPLEVQREIVRILDTLSQLEAELKAELEAELEARRKQYEYYRDALLTFPPPRSAMREDLWRIPGIAWDALFLPIPSI